MTNATSALTLVALACSVFAAPSVVKAQAGIQIVEYRFEVTDKGTGSIANGSIATLDLDTGAQLNQFTPPSLTCQPDYTPSHVRRNCINQPRALVVIGNEVFYTVTTDSPDSLTSYATPTIHVAPFNQGLGGPDTRAIANPIPGSQISAMAFRKGFLYLLVFSYAPSWVFTVVKLNPRTGAVSYQINLDYADSWLQSWCFGCSVLLHGFDYTRRLAVLPNGNFLICNAIYWWCDEYDWLTGVKIGTVMVPDSAFVYGVAADGVFVYFYAVTPAGGGTYLYKTDTFGTVIHKTPMQFHWTTAVSLINPARSVVIDPGHGQILRHGVATFQRQPTATFGLIEDVLTLDIANLLQAILKQDGIEVVMTRNTDRAWMAPPNCRLVNGACLADLNRRARFAERQEAQLMVSIHTNGAPNVRDGPTWNGTEAFFSSVAPAPNSRDLAQAILSQVVQLGPRDRGVLQNNLNVINTSIVSALIEVAFHSNSQLAPGEVVTEEAMLNDPRFRSFAAGAIAFGIMDYFNVHP
jgi:N-acetylmuramoyl-L-alanine amidase